jgi:predicted acetyltransferase
VTLDVRPVAGEHDRATLERLYALYLYDLSEFTDHYVLDEEARWRPDYLSDWLTRGDECHSLLARKDGVPAGFALVAEQPFPYMAQHADQRIAEFFVARTHRGGGIGRRLVDDTLSRFHGVWQINVLPANEPALAFWRRVLPAGVRETREPHDITFWPET